LSFEEVLILSSSAQQKVGKFFVTKDGEIFYDGGKGYLSMGAAALVGKQKGKKEKRLVIISLC